ncbi:MAG: CoB--CoM heterodisulfide reductase subunit C [Candidatus Methanomethylophilaceae archaeon]|nr:CoB--CoM heterodisulfide reductase subunit C [Candidatus Methanomethylophilaceae archaeon]MBQ8643109.1 CoB--CoM heterodisulfide reductase subunit C [Candidatus Methanomethylophilaceae archaeon]
MVTPNPEFSKEIAAAGGEEVKMCFQCGTCTAGCPSGRQTSYRVRKLMRMAQLGLKEEIINSDELWECSTCYTCVERCPRQVPIVDIVISLRNIAVAEGHMFDAHKKTASNLAAYGHTVPVQDKISALRAELGLPEIPPTLLSNENAMADFSKILKAAGFDKIVE